MDLYDNHISKYIPDSLSAQLVQYYLAAWQSFCGLSFSVRFVVCFVAISLSLDKGFDAKAHFGVILPFTRGARKRLDL